MKKVFSRVFYAGFGSFFTFFMLQYYVVPDKDGSSNIEFASVTPRIKFVSSPFETNQANINFVDAAESSVNSVVHVKTIIKDENRAKGDPFDIFEKDLGFKRKNGSGKKGSGSGVIISEDGYIVTNHHVIEGSDQIRIVLNNKRSYIAKLVGQDPATDLALLKIEASGLPGIPLANSDDVRTGEWVLAVGNPFNLTSTVTAGIVSAKGRNINILEYDPSKDLYPIESFIQTDAVVNPGNSGGALVNTYGELIGINTAIASTTGSYSGYSFAIPSNLVKKVVQDLLEFGEVQRAFIGVNIRDIDQKLAAEIGSKELEGIYVAGLTNKGAAIEAGIQEGDIILSIEGYKVNNVPELQEQVGKYRPGDQVAVVIKRKGERMTVPLTLKNQVGTTQVIQRVKNNSNFNRDLGAELLEIENRKIGEHRLKTGVMIKELKYGKLKDTGMKEGFIITHIDKKPVKNTEDLLRALANAEDGVLIEGLYPDGTRAYYGFGS